MRGSFDRSSNHLSDDRSHRTADEAILHGRDQSKASGQISLCVHDGIVQVRGAPRRLQFLSVRLAIDESERIGGNQVIVKRLECPLVKQKTEAHKGADFEMVITLWTDLIVRFKVFLPDNSPA